ncbi:exported hypothetical protein [Nitrolancea hollandica Lb]|uniref:Lipoprotein n=1 Tax=Nitrolancea hollandica Lb TaxID=1129897 RepID=I4EGU9_9BACT|nr:exported hypothetical protein [Nitrolancea hollandica Lb]
MFHGLRRLAVMVVPALVFMSGVVGGCGGSPEPVEEVVTRQTYEFKSAEFPLQDEWKPGDRIDVTWPVEEGPLTAAAAPEKVDVRLELAGPYDSVESLKQAVNAGAPPAVASAIGSTDTWTGTGLTVTLTLPDDLRPGYYNLSQRTVFTSPDGGESSAGGAKVIRVGP